jgi:tRNA pseudouridine38-40 synthase
VKVALGIDYRGSAYSGWQSQPSRRTVQDRRGALAHSPLSRRSAPDARTPAFTRSTRSCTSTQWSARRGWAHEPLPPATSPQWCRFVPASFHARSSALGRRYAYLLLEAPVRPALESGLAGWTFRMLDDDAMRRAAAAIVGTHDFSAFRSSECQALSPVKTLRALAIERRGAYWRFDFDADAFLHHMIRNIVGSLVAVGSGARSPEWLAGVLARRDRTLAAATFAADGLYFLGPYYDAVHAIPDRTAAIDWLP